MKTALLLAALLTTPAAPSAVFDTEMTGFPVGIEEDDGPDALLSLVETKDCTTRFVGKTMGEDTGLFTGPEQQWSIDWKTVDWVRMGDPSFFAVRTKAGKLYGFVTQVDEVDDDTLAENIERISIAAEAALYLHINCEPGAKARYEADGFKFPAKS